MGGDHAPEEVVAGSLDWATRNPGTDVILVGDEARIEALIPNGRPANLTIVPASEAVAVHDPPPRQRRPPPDRRAGEWGVAAMDEHPALAARRKKDASINVCMRLVKEG